MSSQYVFDWFLSLNKSILNIRKNIPYNEITVTNKIPKKIFVLIIAKISNACESFLENNCVIVITITTKTKNASKINKFIADEIMKNQKEKPNVTANALNLGEESSILYRID